MDVWYLICASLTYKGWVDPTVSYSSHRSIFCSNSFFPSIFCTPCVFWIKEAWRWNVFISHNCLAINMQTLTYTNSDTHTRTQTMRTRTLTLGLMQWRLETSDWDGISKKIQSQDHELTATRGICNFLNSSEIAQLALKRKSTPSIIQK